MSPAGAGGDSGRSIQVGTATSYIAISAGRTSDGTPLAHGLGRPLNHVGIEVTNLDDVERRAQEFGLSPLNNGDYEGSAFSITMALSER